MYVFFTLHCTLSLNNRSLKYILQKGWRLQDICTFDVVHLPCNSLIHFGKFVFCQLQGTVLQKIFSIQVKNTLQSTNTDQNYICLTSVSGKPPKLIFGTNAQKHISHPAPVLTIPPTPVPVLCARNAIFMRKQSNIIEMYTICLLVDMLLHAM